VATAQARPSGLVGTGTLAAGWSDLRRRRDVRSSGSVGRRVQHLAQRDELRVPAAVLAMGKVWRAADVPGWVRGRGIAKD